MKLAGLAFIVVALALIANVYAGPPSRDQYNGDSVSVSETEAKAIELAARLLRAARMSPFGYMGGMPSYAKRNSELINSLLGLPKVMNDAGK